MISDEHLATKVLADGHPPHRNGKTKSAPVRKTRDAEGMPFERRRESSYLYPEQPLLAIFCFAPPDSNVGSSVEPLVAALGKRGIAVHLFVPRGLPLSTPGATIHVLGECRELDLVSQVQEFGRRAGNAFLKLFPSPSTPITLLGFDWTAVPPLTLLRGIKNLDVLLCLDSLERQRSDMSGDMSKQIEEIELSGLRVARGILTREPAAAECARQVWPGCGERLVEVPLFPAEDFQSGIDAGALKARYQVGPTDPTILYIGDLQERYGPDLLIKAMPGVLKKHPQARLIVAGFGDLYWPLRVYSRYLLLDHAVRLPGSVEGFALRELVQAADVVAVPSREMTPDWPILAAWAARRPVLATQEAAPQLLIHDHDSVVVYPTVDSCIWGIDHLLSDAKKARTLASNGRDKLDLQFGFNGLAAQVQELMGIAEMAEL